MENEGAVDLYDLAKQITKYSSLSLGDVSNVLENMIDAVSLFLLMGRGVRIGRLGTLRIILKSDGVDTPEEFNCHLINHVKLHFTPSVQLKKQLEDVSYEMIK
jgi:predicted histone-like DNA-binding protein